MKPVFLLVLVLFNCASAENMTRLEKWSQLTREEESIYGKEIKTFGKLKPFIERKPNTILNDEFIEILFESENFAEEICKEISVDNKKESARYIKKLDEFVFSKNMNVLGLDKSFDPNPENFGRPSCQIVPKDKIFILEDLRNYTGKLLSDLDHPLKGNRQGKLNALLSRIKTPNTEFAKDTAELQMKIKNIQKTNSTMILEVNELTRWQYFNSKTVYFVTLNLGLLRNIVGYGPNPLTRLNAYIWLSSFFYIELNPSLLDREKITQQTKPNSRSEYFVKHAENSEILLKDTQYLVLNDKDNFIQGFYDFAASLDFHISSYEELYKFHRKEDYSIFKTSPINNICMKYDCNAKADLDRLKKKATYSIEELKKTKSMKMFYDTNIQRL